MINLGGQNITRRIIKVTKSVTITIALFYFHASFAGFREDTLKASQPGECLKYICKVIPENKPANPIEATLFLDNEIIDHTVLNNTDKFDYTLKSDSYYIIQISCPFYITRYVIIDTNIPGKIKGEIEGDGILYVHDMKMDLFRQPQIYYPPNVNSDILDEPITIIRYNSEEDIFGCDTKYTRKMKRELRIFKKKTDTLKMEQSPKQKVKK